MKIKTLLLLFPSRIPLPSNGNPGRVERSLLLEDNRQRRGNCLARIVNHLEQKGNLFEKNENQLNPIRNLFQLIRNPFEKSANQFQLNANQFQ